jgi:hypothetical protein
MVRTIARNGRTQLVTVKAIISDSCIDETEECFMHMWWDARPCLNEAVNFG